MFFSDPILGALVIFFVRLLSIAISTVRLLIMGRSNPLLVAFLAFTEALAFAITFGQVASNLTNFSNLGAYSLGFAVGTWVGTKIEERFIKGYSTVTVISMGKSLPISEAIEPPDSARHAPLARDHMAQLVWYMLLCKNAMLVVLQRWLRRSIPKPLLQLKKRAASHGAIWEQGEVNPISELSDIAPEAAAPG